MPHPTVRGAVMAVQAGEADRAVVPIENSLEGPVTATLDVLAGEATEVWIARELVHPVHHCLVARRSMAPAEVSRVVTHPQALAQCARFLREDLSHAEQAAAASTAEAVRLVTATEERWAAIGTRLAAELYGAVVLAERIEDRPDNETRFVWLVPRSARGAVAAGGRGPVGDRMKTSIVFWGFNDASPGALVAVLRELADRDINLTKIESRPRRVRLGRYMFFADLEGGVDDPAVHEALEGLDRRVESLRVLGSYPAA